jgi:hypothetical protein
MVWTAYNHLGHPLATGKAVLPKLTPGSVHLQKIEWKTFSDLSRVQVEIFRPNGFSVLDADWTK